MPESATRLPRARTSKPPVWLDAIDFYKASFDATSAETLTEGAEAFAEMSPDDQAFHQAHLTYRQVQALGDVHLTLRRIDARLAGMSDEALAGLKDVPMCRKALVSIARGQNQLLRMLAQGGLSEAVRGGGDDDDDDDELDSDEDAEIVETEDHGNGASDAIVPDEIIPAGARRPTPEAA